MRLLFKLVGFILIILTTSTFGFFKASSFNLRYKKLCNIKNSISDLKHRIRLSHNEIDKLINISFKNIPDYHTNLEKSDIEIIDSFFKNLGSGDTESECERCELCITLLDTQITSAQNNYNQLNKLYKSIGFLSGLFICIFFL